MKNKKTHNSFKFSLFMPSRLIFREGSPDNADSAKANADAKAEKELVESFNKTMLPLIKEIGSAYADFEKTLKEITEKIKNPEFWPILRPEERKVLKMIAEQKQNISNNIGLKPVLGTSLDDRTREKIRENPKNWARLPSAPLAIIERTPKISELNNLGKKLCEYAKNLPKQGKIFDIMALTRLFIIKEGNMIKVSKVEGYASDLTFKTDYYFDTTSGNYLKGTLYINAQGKVTKHESDPNELLKLVPPLLVPTNINGSERILSTKSLNSKVEKGPVPNR